jgi:hypothetical protein
MVSWNSPKLDAEETVFFSRQLEYVKARTYDIIHRDLKATRLLPVSTEVPLGATEITWRSYEQYGQAKIIADYAHDFPRVDLFGTENTIKVKDIGDSYGYSVIEIRRAMYAGFDLEQRRARAARQAIDQRIDQIAWFGDANYNIQGFIDYPGITEYIVPVGAAGDTTWATKTADEILADLNGIYDAIYVSTAGKEMPDTILLPIQQNQLIRNTRIGTASDTTIYEFFTRNHPGVTIEELVELNDAGDPDTDDNETDRFMAYQRSEDKVTLEIPMAFEQLEEEKEGMEYQIPCHASTAGVIIYYPMSVAYGDGI